MRVLVRMALVAKDSDARPIYWGGWEVLAHALGCNMPDRDAATPEADRLRRNGQRAVERATAELVSRDAVARLAHGRAGQQAEYLLNLTPVDKSQYREA